MNSQGTDLGVGLKLIEDPLCAEAQKPYITIPIVESCLRKNSLPEGCAVMS